MQEETHVTGRVEDWFQDRAEIKEQPFHSDAPLIGSIIARFRDLWNSVAAKWYVRPLLQQQNHFNRLVVQRLRDQELRLIEQDREQTAMTHDLAQLTAQLTQANRLLTSIDERLARLENRLDESESSER